MSVTSHAVVHSKTMVARRWPYAALIGLGALTAAAFVSQPQGVGGLAFGVFGTTCTIAMAIGPVLRRAQPRRAWRYQTASAVCFLGATLVGAGAIPTSAGVLAQRDVWMVVAYLTLITCYVRLLLAHPGQGGRTMLLDGGIISGGVFLAFWSGLLASGLRGAELRASYGGVGSAAASAFFASCDGLMLMITFRLAYAVGRQVPAVTALLVAAGGRFITTTAFAAADHFDSTSLVAVLDVAIVATITAMVIATTHPSSVDLPGQARPTTERSPGRRSMLLLLLVVPAGAAIGFPVSGRYDALVRIVVLALILMLVYLRLATADDERDLADASALHRTRHDTLTELPNRTAFLADTAKTLEAADRDGGLWTLLLLDLDRFKHVNDTWGHSAGDELIRALGERLCRLVRAEDIVYRIGGDEFVILAQLPLGDQLSVIAQRVLSEIAQPVTLGSGQVFNVTASIGVSQAESPAATSAEELLRDADIALFTAKDRGRATWTLFDTSLRDRVTDRVRLAEDLNEAVPGGQIVAFYQPIRGAAGFDTLTGFEALARWHHPQRGLLCPTQFIPLAEDSGRIVEVGEAILRQACRDVARWRRMSGAELHVSVNVSAVQIARSDVAAAVAAALQDEGLPPCALWIEITESLLMQDKALALRTIESLSAVGVKICIDDFGTGYSSLGYLKDFPVDVVKVDRAFVAALTDDRRAITLTGAIIDMVHALGLDGVVAEGVERQDQADILTSLGCTWGQGFLWGRPIPADRTDALLAEEALPRLVPSDVPPADTRQTLTSGIARHLP
ncbi:MAG: bifunctional diguanylate cyclase/phosphodiesterase [Kineosporiaceae bacterium]|nr:bifunctional diguanylate cyclase/phosphodiesterase [Kineosporiaceae bacterium]